jgi:hypothetical protein
MATSNQIQTILLQNGVQLPDIFTRLRTDLNQWARFGITANVAGNQALAPTSLIPGLATYPCLLLQNNGSVEATLSFKPLNGNPTIAIAIPAGDYVYLPKIDYATGIVSLTVVSGTAPCLGYFGYIQ